MVKSFRLARSINTTTRKSALFTFSLFQFFRQSEQVPKLVSLLAESYHPHLRYGAAMAVGIACAGTANKEAINLLETLLDGTVHFVRQGALIALSMVLCQQNAVTCPKVNQNYSLDFGLSIYLSPYCRLYLVKGECRKKTNNNITVNYVVDGIKFII